MFAYAAKEFQKNSLQHISFGNTNPKKGKKKKKQKIVLFLLNKNIYNKVREIKNLTIIVDETLFLIICDIHGNNRDIKHKWIFMIEEDTDEYLIG